MIEGEEKLTGADNPAGKLEKGTDTRNPIIRVLEKFGDLFVLNLIFVLSCLPLITIGASVTALYTMTNKMVRNEEGTIWKGFWKAFGQNFKIGTKLWFLLLLYLGIIYVEYMYMLQTSGTVADLMVVAIGFEMLLLSFTLPLLFPLAARYENTVGNYIRNAVVLSISHLKIWFFVFFMWFVPVLASAASALVFAYTWYLWLLIVCSILAYSTSMVLQKLFDELEAPKKEKTEEKAEEKAEQKE